ncbi:MAG: ParB N-terminal domain-containing protein [Candidatus Caldarchaeum sp.]
MTNSLTIRSKTLAWLPVSELIPNDRNWRIHTEKQRKALIQAIKKLGWIAPLIVSKQTKRILDGHLRFEIAKELGYTKLPCVLLDIDESQELLVVTTTDSIGSLAIPEFVFLGPILDEINNHELKTLIDFVLPIEPLEIDPEELTFSELSALEEPNDTKLRKVYFNDEEWDLISKAFPTLDPEFIVSEIERMAIEETDVLREGIRSVSKEIKRARREARQAYYSNVE